ncbi:MAG: hypothetical protein EA355_12985 [Rhodobacteraceae bacterium]|nr:MAG: hypothetical protein EA355_12985 [Paracoccaceae bacterium]
MVFAGEKHGQHGHRAGFRVGSEPVDRAIEGDVAQTLADIVARRPDAGRMTQAFGLRLDLPDAFDGAARGGSRRIAKRDAGLRQMVEDDPEVAFRAGREINPPDHGAARRRRRAPRDGHPSRPR